MFSVNINTPRKVTRRQGPPEWNKEPEHDVT